MAFTRIVLLLGALHKQTKDRICLWLCHSSHGLSQVAGYVSLVQCSQLLTTLLLQVRIPPISLSPRIVNVWQFG